MSLSIKVMSEMKAVVDSILSGVLNPSPIRATCGAPVITTFAAALVSKSVLPANSARKGFILWNNSANSCYVTFGPVAVAAKCTYIVPTFQSLTVTSGAIYTGELSVIRNAGTGDIAVYELV